MATTLPVLLLEFNELSPRLMDQLMAAGQLPNFKILHDESEVHVTGAVEKHPYLEPWIQWITVHCGLATASPIGGPRMSGVHAQAARGEQGELANAILFGYQTMDRLVAEFGDSSARTARSSSVPR